MRTRSRLVPTLLLLAALAPAACGVAGGGAPGNGAAGDGATETGPGMSGSGAARSELVVTVDDGTGGAPSSWTLTCDPPGGDHPDPGAACRAIEAARAPFAPVPAGMACTQIYGGPQTATIEGTWRGAPVRASYRATDGCEIARWTALAAVLRSGGAT